MSLICVDLKYLICHYYDSDFSDKALSHGDRPVAAAIATLRHVSALLATRSPTHLLLGFDPPDSTTRRRRIYLHYKPRSAKNPDLKRAFNLTIAAANLLRWPVISHSGWEADDSIASACQTYPGHVLIVSGDRDFFALCCRRVRLQLLRGSRRRRGTLGPADVLRILGVRPDQVSHLKALTGEHCDNIPGARGAGPATAVTLLKNFGTLSAIYRRLDDGAHIRGLPRDQAMMLRHDRQAARRSARLAALRTHLPIDVPELSTAHTRTFDEVREDLENLGLGGLFARVRYRRPPRRRSSCLLDGSPHDHPA